MKKRIIKCIALVLAFNCFGMMASANDIPYEIEYKYSESKMTISGTSENENDVMAIQILKGGVSFDDEYAITDVLYTNQFKTGEDKKYVFDIDFTATDNDYEAGVSSKTQGIKTPFTVHLVSQEEFTAAYTAVNGYVEADNFADFCSYINANADDLNMSFSLTNGKTLNSELTDYYAYLKTNPLQTANETDNTKKYKTYITSYELNNGKITNIDDYMSQLNYDDDDVYTLYDGIAESDEIQKYFTSKMTNKSITDLTKFENVAKEALMLTTVRYSDGIDDIKDVIGKYGSVINISGTISDSGYRQLSGNDYADGAALKIAFDAQKGSGGGGGGAGGGSGSGAGSNKKDESPLSGAVIYNPVQTEGSKPSAPVKTVFNDIDGVLWASEAIHALADKGIINGKGENIFAPNDTVTREEFTKMLIGAMGISEDEYSGNVFADVPDDAWYVKCVNIANKNGIVTGTGEGKFGVGVNITRQDMAVMLYRALLARNANVSVTDVTFGDKDSISDYATDAVSALTNLGAINGVGDNRFDPLGYATRAQAAKVIYGILNQL